MRIPALLMGPRAYNFIKVISGAYRRNTIYMILLSHEIQIAIHQYLIRYNTLKGHHP